MNPALIVVLVNTVFVVVLGVLFAAHARFLRRNVNERFEAIRARLEADANALLRNVLDRPHTRD